MIPINSVVNAEKWVQTLILKQRKILASQGEFVKAKTKVESLFKFSVPIKYTAWGICPFSV